ncbi:major facilitator superfamily domain-containing protein [Gamsiella multidivaricata]|uniref:major facilitator superfamily domain-containing protein n=1 Tax=Gamsiella multidivaricata TaxID=101098 RepID=UPI00221F93EE|nr:major facilitator superfamily domain-containing protein [Gamsiella multidivaricata]KAI7830536.1 major facilitator superfamily domain-containing protein [Gamsiella multidivaricata]
MTFTREISSAARAASFLAACAVALVSGTPYLYSTYANQLTTKLDLTALQSNAVAAGVHYGLFLSGPLFGRLVDSRGPKVVGLYAAGLLMTGYTGLALTYSGLFYSFGFFLAFVFLILVGMGSQAGYMTSVSTNAHNFQSARGLAMGVPIACFGLSALLFAQINNHFYKDDTQAFLYLVARAIAGTILISILFLNVVPVDGQDGKEDPELAVTAARSLSIEHSEELNDEVAEERRRRTQEQERLLVTSSAAICRPVSGFKLFTTILVAQLLFLSIMLLSGPGLMYVTNAGNVIRSIYLDHMVDPSTPPTEEELIRLQQLQNYHVSLISLCSCLGRISVGLMSDLGKRGSGRWWGISRIGFLLYAGICVWLGQTFGANVSDIGDLTKVSVLVGLGYGSVFGVAPTIVSEWFGVNSFGSNWGWISVGNAIGGQIFNLIFGSLYDRQAQHEHTLQCFGPECFRTSFVLGTCSSSLGVAVLIYLAFITRRGPAIGRRE